MEAMRRMLTRAEWLDLHKLRVFVAVAEQQHFTRAADDLAISQPALSAHVRDLERHLGMQLFERVGRGVRLTDTGHLVLGYARRLLALAVELEEAVDDLKELRAGQLRIGASTTVGEYLLPNALAAFRRAYPAVQIAVDIANTARIADRLRHGELHLGLVGEPLTDPDLVCEPCWDDDLLLIVPSDHTWAGRIVVPADLNGVSLVAREAGSATRAVAKAALERAHIRPVIALELGSTEAVKGAVMAGLGVAFVSACAVARELAAGQLAQAFLPALSIRRQFQVVRRQGRQLTAAEAAFLPLLRR